MLTDVEAVFRSLKSELGLRPVFHRKTIRTDGHLFVMDGLEHQPHLFGRSVRHCVQYVTVKMHHAPLPFCLGVKFPKSFKQAKAFIGYHQIDSFNAAFAQTAQKLPPIFSGEAIPSFPYPK
jgi:hypothetical protein